MNLLKKIMTRAAYSLLPILLFSFGLSWSLYMVFGTPQPLQRALSSSGIYSISIPSLIQNQSSVSFGDVPINQPEIQDALQKAFPPALLEQYSNEIITGSYDWVQGRTATPNFSVDTSAAKENFANNVAAYVQQRSAALPICTSIPQATDPYTLTCRPKQTPPDAIASAAKQQILSSDFLKTSTFDASTIKDSNGRPLSEQLEIVPKAYKWTIWNMYGTGILALACIAFIVFFQRKQWQGAARRLGILSMTVGLASGAIAWVASYILDKLATKLLASAASQELVQTKLVVITQTLVDDLRHYWLGYGIALAVMGLIGWIAGKAIKPRAVALPLATPEPATMHDLSSAAATPPVVEPEDKTPHKPVV
jgi:hypothetical protein